MKRVSIHGVVPEGVSHDPAIRKRVLLRAGDLPPLLQFAQVRLAPGQSTCPHRHHDLTEVFWVEAGAGVLRVDRVEAALAPGICCVVEPGETHELRATGEEDLVVTYFGLAAGPG